MENLVFALNATIPVFLVMVAGFVLRKMGLIDETFASKMSRFVFLVPLPLMQFRQLAVLDIREIWDTRFVLYCFVTTLLSIVLSWFLARFIKNHGERGEFMQVAYRSSQAILGAAYLTGIYGNAEMLPIMVIGSVPLYNAAAVIILESTAPEKTEQKSRNLFLDILKNPIIIGVAAGILWSLLRIPVPAILNSTLSTIGGLTTPMGLLAMGANIHVEEIRGELKDSLFASALKLVLWCVLFLPVAGWLGFRGQKLIAALVMLGSPATISCYIMARSMGHKGELTSNTVALSTLIGAFTMTFWIYLLKTMGWL